MLLRTALVSLALLVLPAFAAFGITVSGKYMTVDTDGGLVFKGMVVFLYLQLLGTNSEAPS